MACRGDWILFIAGEALDLTLPRRSFVVVAVVGKRGTRLQHLVHRNWRGGRRRDKTK